MERREAHLVSFRFRHRLRGDGLPEAHRLAALHCGDFGRRDRTSGWGRGAHRLLIRPAFAAFVRTSSSRERQSHVVGPDGDPSLPDDMVANHARRRRILLRFKSALESAPHEQDVSNLRALRSAGIRIPITKCCRLCALDTIAVFPGRAFARTRNLYRDCKPVMDSGSAPSAHPGMTGWEVAASGV